MPIHRVRMEAAKEQWLLQRQADDKSESILRQNRITLDRFMRVNGENIVVYDVAPHHVNTFLVEAAKTRAQNSLNNDRACLDLFFEWCRNMRYMASFNNPMFGHKRAKIVERDRLRVPYEEFDLLINSTECERDRAMVASGLGMVLRMSELARIRIGDLDLPRRRVRVQIPKTKRPDDRMVINEWYWPDLKRWLELYPQMIKRHLEPSDFLIPGRYGHQPFRDRKSGLFYRGTFGNLRPETPVQEGHKIVQKALVQIGYQIKLPDTVLPDGTRVKGRSLYEGQHTLRRSGARAAYDFLIAQGIDNALTKIQELLHHVNPNHTRRYIGLESLRDERDSWMESMSLYPPRYDGAMLTNLGVERQRRAVGSR